MASRGEALSVGDARRAIDARVAAVGAAELEAPVRSLLGDPAAQVVAWRHERIAHDYLNPSTGGIYRFTATAGTPWSLVLKVTRSDDAQADPVRVEAVRWDRELLAYESGFLASLEGDLVAPACHGAARFDDGTCWLWLEDLGGSDEPRWSLERWSRVGRALGAFNGRELTAARLRTDDWLGRNWLRVWLLHITPELYPGATGPGEPWEPAAVRAAYPAALRERVWALWAERHELLAAVEALPRTVCHLDAHRSNLFPRDDRIVAIDWGLVGLAAAGEELASALVGTVASGKVAAADAAALAERLYDSYLEGLAVAGWNGDEREIRVGFTAAAALRALSVLRLDAAADPATLQRAAAFVSFLADLGDEARSLLAALPARPGTIHS